MMALRTVAVAALLAFAAATPEGEAGEVRQLGDAADPQEPPQPWLRAPVVKEHMPGKPLKSVGYPKQKRLRSPEADSLHGAENEIQDLKNQGKWTPRERPYPGGGKMNAADIKNTIGEIAPLIAIAQKGKAADQEFGLLQSKLESAQNQRLIAKMKAGVVGKRLTNGALMQQQGILQGNLGNCRTHLLTCNNAEEVQELGESDDLPPAPWRPPTETAREEWRRKNGEQIAGVQAVRKRRPAQQEKHTASEEYAKSQTGGKWDTLPGMPGMKLSHDRLTATHLRAMVSQAATMIQRAKKMNAEEDAAGLERVRQANKRAIEAQVSTNKVKEAIEKMEAPPSTAMILKHMKEIGAELKTCMAKVLTKCGSQPFQAAYPASTVKAVLNQIPNPRDSQAYRPDPLQPKKGPGGDAPITPSE